MIDQYKKIGKFVCAQVVVTFVSSFGLSEIHFLGNIIARYFQKVVCLAGNHNFDQVKKCLISQGSAVTFFRCGRRVHKIQCQVSSVYQKNSPFLTELYKKCCSGGNFFSETQCT